MNYDELTVEAKQFLLTFYKAYYEKMKNGESRDCARKFSDIYKVHNQYFFDWPFNTALDIVNELSRKGWLDNLYGDNVPVFITLKTESIAQLQQRFSKGTKQILSELTKLKNLFA